MSPTRVGNVVSWASDIEIATIDQAQRAASLPFIHGHVALMADAHIGKGATIGSVLATTGAVIPSAVGVDIGCGIAAVETPFTSGDLPDDLSGLHSLIAMAVPAGVGRGHGRVADRASELLADPRVELSQKQEHTAGTQLGSLGSGNHFVEVCLDERDHVWIVLHSGSRGIGNQLATVHIEAAKGLMKQYFIELDDPDLAYLVEGTSEFDEYIAAMLWAQDYAATNRDAMVDAVIDQLGVFLGQLFVAVSRINCHHNFCELEHHDGHNVWVTRKGAIRARTGDFGVIPGSMGTRSYIVRGKGSAASYHSSSHGAGRRLSRGRARRELDLDGFRAQMVGKTLNDADATRLIDEDPRAYKDIDQVMNDQRDLVEIVHTLTQVLNYKGV